MPYSDSIQEFRIGSEFEMYLSRILADGRTHTIRFQVREFGIAVKANEGMWTHALNTGVSNSETGNDPFDADSDWNESHTESYLCGN